MASYILWVVGHSSLILHPLQNLHFLSIFCFSKSAVFTMKVITSFLALATAAHAHYNFPSMISGGTTTPEWQSVRQWTGYYTFQPVTNVASLDIRCNANGSSAFAPSTLSIAAGSTAGFSANPDIYHPGPLLVYMAKVPTGKTAANWDGSGAVWFKIYQEGPTFGGQALSWPTDSTFLHPPRNH